MLGRLPDVYATSVTRGAQNKCDFAMARTAEKEGTSSSARSLTSQKRRDRDGAPVPKSVPRKKPQQIDTQLEPEEDTEDADSTVANPKTH